METVYRKVPCTERLPKESGHYYCETSSGSHLNLRYDADKQIWNGMHPISVAHWLEEVLVSKLIREELEGLKQRIINNRMAGTEAQEDILDLINQRIKEGGK